MDKYLRRALNLRSYYLEELNKLQKENADQNNQRKAEIVTALAALCVVISDGRYELSYKEEKSEWQIV